MSTPTLEITNVRRIERDRPRWIPGTWHAAVLDPNTGRVLRRGWRSRGYMSDTERGYTKKPRLYVDVEGEGFWEAFGNRTSRPSTLYRTVVREALERIGVPADAKVRWDRNAGCSMCPCSPGFVVEYERRKDRRRNGTRRNERPFDVYVTVRVVDGDRTEALTTNPAEADMRLVQVAADPTMPFPADVRDAALAALGEVMAS